MRNEYFKSAYSVAEENVKSNGPLMGTLFWHWYDEGMGPGQVRSSRWCPRCMLLADALHTQYGVHVSDSTFPIITAHVDFMNAVFHDAPDLCPA